MSLLDTKRLKSHRFPRLLNLTVYMMYALQHRAHALYKLQTNAVATDLDRARR